MNMLVRFNVQVVGEPGRILRTVDDVLQLVYGLLVLLFVDLGCLWRPVSLGRVRDDHRVILVVLVRLNQDAWLFTDMVDLT